jgi:hypothetical protein
VVEPETAELVVPNDESVEPVPANWLAETITIEYALVTVTGEVPLDHAEPVKVAATFPVDVSKIAYQAHPVPAARQTDAASVTPQAVGTAATVPTALPDAFVIFRPNRLVVSPLVAESENVS